MDGRGRETFKGQAEKEPSEPERLVAARARQRQGEAQVFSEKRLASLIRPSTLPLRGRCLLLLICCRRQQDTPPLFSRALAV